MEARFEFSGIAANRRTHSVADRRDEQRVLVIEAFDLAELRALRR
jgi:hypothetical protein